MMQEICAWYQLSIPRNNILQNKNRAIRRNAGWFRTSKIFEDVMVMLLSYSKSRGFKKFLIIAIATINTPIITTLKLEADKWPLFGGWVNFRHFSANFTYLKHTWNVYSNMKLDPLKEKRQVQTINRLCMKIFVYKTCKWKLKC